MLRNQPRCFREDAERAASRLPNPLRIIGEGNIPKSGPCLVTINHYSRPGFPAWWLAMAASAVIPADVHWIVTSAWTYSDRLRSESLTPISRWLFRRIAEIYGFSNMPPMPPNPQEVLQRAHAVRSVLNFVRNSPNPIIGFAPEGGDFALPGELAVPPPGVGRFILLLSQLGLAIVPLGIFELNNTLCLNFGKPYELNPPLNVSRAESDWLIRQEVINRIRSLLEYYNVEETYRMNGAPG